jgi:hypothetical protein
MSYETCGSLYNTSATAAVAEAVTWITAAGTNSPRQSLAYWRGHTGAEATAKAAAAGWVPDYDWGDVWPEVGECLAARAEEAGEEEEEEKP